MPAEQKDLRRQCVIDAGAHRIRDGVLGHLETQVAQLAIHIAAWLKRAHPLVVHQREIFYRPPTGTRDTSGQTELCVHPSGIRLSSQSAIWPGRLKRITLHHDLESRGCRDIERLITVNPRGRNTACDPALPTALGLKGYLVPTRWQVDFKGVLHVQDQVQGQVVVNWPHQWAEIDVSP